MNKNFNNEPGINDLINAQNRTTHAVRAFVRFLFIQLTGITLAILIWNASNLFINEENCRLAGDNCSGNSFLQFLSALTLIISVFWSSQVGWRELAKSEIPVEQDVLSGSVDSVELTPLKNCTCGEKSPSNYKRCGACGKVLIR